jgi:hypothetical protein
VSIMGRNAVYGSRVTVYRPTMEIGSGGQTELTWTPVVVDLMLELHQRSAEMTRQIFGLDVNVALMAVVDLTIDIRDRDALTVLAGLHADSTFRVIRTLLSRKYRELGLERADDDETIPFSRAGRAARAVRARVRVPRP